MVAEESQKVRETLYEVIPTKQYRKDRRRLGKSGRYRLEKLDEVIQLLANGHRLPDKYRNHRLKGAASGFEECHIEPDWLLIYQRFENELILILLQTGTHSQLFNE